MITPIIICLFITRTICSEEYEIFSKPMVSEGAVYNQTMFEMEEDHERLCGKEGRLLKENRNMLVQCSSDSQCLPPSQCHSSGYCCMIALHQEPPPVGCPMGTRSLRNSSGAELSCNPNVPNSCPGGAMCYTDSLTQERRCCGSDPGQGCPAGSRAFLSGSSPLLCTPGRSSCPNGALCQWSHLIDRYQCCEPDNGCPRHQAPLKTDRGETLTCSPGGPPCPGGAGCRFNFWTASYQCCRTDTADLCPSGQVPFLRTTDGSPQSCKKDRDCPPNFLCGDNSLCCGQPGACPGAYSPMKDAYGRLTACSSRNDNTCPSSSSCQTTSTATQKLCCIQEDYKCPDSSIPFPNVRDPETCVLGNPFACSQGQCMPSNVPGVSICCRSPFQNIPLPNSVCPSGWSPYNNQITYCTPSTYSSTCPGFSSCIRSSSVQQQFVCCIPGKSAPSDTCQRSHAIPERVNGIARRCTPRKKGQCSVNFSCQPSIRNGWLCCSSPQARAQAAQFACPMSGQTPVITAQGANQFCTLPGQRAECPQNALCVSSSTSPFLNICCNSATQVTPICPNNAVPQPSSTGYVPCTVTSNSCAAGYTCVNAANDFNIQMCCTSNAVQNPVCPNQQTLLMDLGRPRYCLVSQVSACPSGYSCQAAVGTAGTYVCCTLPTAATCPTSFTPSIDNRGSPIFCSPSQPAGCPSGSVCLQSPNSNSLFLCCRSATSPRVCPNNLNALLTPSGSLETCTGPGSQCSRVGYSCLLSNVLAQYVCCGQEQQNAVCADGRETFTQTSGQTYTCNPLTFPTGCPVQYDCAISTVAGTNVCCRSNTVTVVPTTTPISVLQCPNGWNPHKNAIDGQLRTCSGTFDMSCPTGYSCTPASLPNTFVCCRLATSLSCTRGTTFLANSQPRLCSRTRPNQCPRGYVCEQSTNPTVTICCSSTQLDEPILCPDRSTAAFINNNVRSCPILNSAGGCPAGYVCQQSNKGMNVCCASIGLTRHSPSSVSSNKQSQAMSSVQCSNGVEAGILSSNCKSDADCPSQSTCQPSRNVPGVSLCCSSPIPADTRCKGRRTKLSNGKPVECLLGNNCGTGYECSDFTLNSRSVCCESEAEALSVCPENRLPYIIARSEKLVFCDETAYMCPAGQECKQTKDGRRFACCSAVGQCKSGIAEMVNGSPKRCFSSISCSTGYSCEASSVDGMHVCCSQNTTLQQPFSSPPKAEVSKDNSDQEWVVIEG